MRLFLKCKSGVILSSEQIREEQSSFEQAGTELFIAPLYEIASNDVKQRGEVWRHVTMVAKFLDLNNLSWKRQRFVLSNDKT